MLPRVLRPVLTLRGPTAAARLGPAPRRAFTAGTSGGVQEERRAGLLVIGNEILNGSISDVNLPFLARTLHNRGVDLVRCEFVRDDPDEIADRLLQIKKLVGPTGAVFTSGGIGPTHDDVTYDSIAGAYGVNCELHAPTVARMEDHYGSQGKELTPARLRMAKLPLGSEVIWTQGTWVPLAVIERTYILPGIPKLFQKMVNSALEQHPETFTGPTVFSRTMFTKTGEGDLAGSLSAIAERHPKADIGSYPNTGKDPDKDYTTKLVVISRDEELVKRVQEEILGAIDCFE